MHSNRFNPTVHLMQKSTLLALLGSLLILPFAYGQKYHSGSVVKSFQASDQHGEAYQLDSKTRYLLISFDMGTGKKANVKLDQKGKEFFKEKQIAFVANIHGMPGIGRLFAFKKMKTYSHRIIYGDDAHLMDPFPEKDDHVTVLKLDKQQKVTQISYWDPAKEEVDQHLKE